MTRRLEALERFDEALKAFERAMSLATPGVRARIQVWHRRTEAAHRKRQ